MHIPVSSLARNELVGFSGVIERQLPRYRKLKLKAFYAIVGVRLEQNPYSAELAVILCALNTLPGLKGYRFTLLTSNKAAALTLRNLRQQSGQGHVCQIYRLIRKLRRNGNQIYIRWVPANEENKLLGLAKSRLGQRPKKTRSYKHEFLG
jgi:hypothetical protein